MQTNERSEESHSRSDLTPSTPAAAPRSSAEIRLPVAPAAEMEMEVPVAGQQALRRRDELTEERIARIRQRILEGAYASEAVIDTVARRILKARDL